MYIYYIGVKYLETELVTILLRPFQLQALPFCGSQQTFMQCMQGNNHDNHEITSFTLIESLLSGVLVYVTLQQFIYQRQSD